MSHTVDGQTTTYTWDVAASLPVVLKDTTYTYVYGLGLISATDSGGNQNYYMHNGQGSVANIVDYNGTEKAEYLYDAFGNTRYTLELTPNVWLYSGEQQDDGTGFYYLRARYYDPFLGRFITRDPLGEGNGYSYAFNNPVNLIDPYGLFGCGDLGPLGGACQEGWDALEAGANVAVDLAVQTANTAASAVAGCWHSTLCRTLSVEAGVFACSALTGGWGAVGCAAAGSLVLSYDEAVDCVHGSEISCGNVALNVGMSAAAAGAGTWLKSAGFKIGLHTKHTHHSELFRGDFQHLQVNWHTIGGRSGNGGDIHIPIPWELPRKWHWERVIKGPKGR